MTRNSGCPEALLQSATPRNREGSREKLCQSYLGARSIEGEQNNWIPTVTHCAVTAVTQPPVGCPTPCSLSWQKPSATSGQGSARA